MCDFAPEVHEESPLIERTSMYKNEKVLLFDRFHYVHSATLEEVLKQANRNFRHVSPIHPVYVKAGVRSPNPRVCFATGDRLLIR